MFTELYREKKREEGDRGGQADKRGEWNGERQVQPIISSLSVLHHEGHPERLTALHGEEKREEGVRADPNEMRWNQ